MYLFICAYSAKNLDAGMNKAMRAGMETNNLALISAKVSIYNIVSKSFTTIGKCNMPLRFIFQCIILYDQTDCSVRVNKGVVIKILTKQHKCLPLDL